MTLVALKQQLLEKKPLGFCREVLFAPYAWIFDAASGYGLTGTYYDFRRTIGDLVNENPNNIGIVGSAKLGFRLQPNSQEPFKPFGDHSDIDVIIVSRRLFLEIWQGYRRAYYNGYYWLKDKHGGNVFRNFVILHSDEKEEYKSIYLRDFWVAMQNMLKDVSLKHKVRRPIKFRIYATWEDAENYHVAGVEKLRKEIQNGNE